MSTSFFFFFMNTLPGESTAAVIPAFTLKTDSDSSPYPHATLELFPPIPASALLALQIVLIRDFSSATGEVILFYCTWEGGPSERWEGGSANVASAVLVFACPPGSTLVARRDDPLLLRGNTRRSPSK